MPAALRTTPPMWSRSGERGAEPQGELAHVPATQRTRRVHAVDRTDSLWTGRRRQLRPEGGQAQLRSVHGVSITSLGTILEPPSRQLDRHVAPHFGDPGRVKAGS